MKTELPSIVDNSAPLGLSAVILWISSRNILPFLQLPAGLQQRPEFVILLIFIGYNGTLPGTSRINEVAETIQRKGGADFILHLAAFYDFDYTDNTAYQRTNIDGTKNVIELAKLLKVNRFIFASSLAACNFPRTRRICY